MGGMDQKRIVVALAGNPNAGKSTIFNNITGTRQKVGNWPGVTVEKKEGQASIDGRDLTIVDLPGTYSLAAYSIEELVARNYILDEKPDVVANVIDASNLERNLYLATQIRELNANVILVLNMADVAKNRGISIDAKKLSELLGLPVVCTVGNKNEGTRQLLEAIVSVAGAEPRFSHDRRVRYGADIEKALDGLAALISEAQKDGQGPLKYEAHWIAVKLLEGDQIIREQIGQFADGKAAAILTEADNMCKNIERLYNEDAEIVMTDYRYGFVSGIIQEVVKTSSVQRVDVSRQVDKVLTNRILGLPVFMFLIWAMFQLTFSVGAYPMDWLRAGVGLFGVVVGDVLPHGLFRDLVIDGALAGVGAVIVFLPNILILFFFIALLEDTGYMARAAFLMDKLMHLVGLHGKSFIPLLMGFGCNAPAIMATRTLESHKDRLLTILINPLMSCSARLPVYILLAGTFFGANAGNVILSLYILGIVLAIVMGRLFRSTILKGEIAPFVMELPPYRLPTIKGLLIHMWERSKIFFKKMGGVILVGSVVVWVLSVFPRNIDFKNYEGEISAVRARYEAIGAGLQSDSDKKALYTERDEALRALEVRQAKERVEYSYIGRIGKFMEPAFRPLGMDWRVSVSLLTGFVAKEIVVSTLGVLFVSGAEEHGGDAALKNDSLKVALQRSGMTPLSAYALMTFILIYVPCLATVAVIRRETNSWKWTFFSMGYSTGLAWIVAAIIYQGGRLVGLG